MNTIKLTLFYLLLVSTIFLSAQTPQLVADINPTETYTDHITWVNTTHHIDMGSYVLYRGNDQMGDELWRTDGTVAGTFLVKDLVPGAFSGNPENFIEFKGKAYFQSGNVLWVSDGTTSGTQVIYGGYTNLAWPGIEYRDSLYFAADDGVNGIELWRSDGTNSGTALFKDIYQGSNSGNPGVFTLLDTMLIFVARTSSAGSELWKSDGSPSGTVLLKDIRPGSANSFISVMELFNGQLFFRANDGTNGIEPWKTDGTTAGTALVKNIASGSSNSSPDFSFSVVRNGKMYFSASGSSGREIYETTDGTPANTQQFTNLGSPLISDIALINDTIIFTATSSSTGIEPWKIGFTPFAQTLLKDIAPGTTNSLPGKYFLYNGKLYFNADAPATGAELWATDGTIAGTNLVKDIYPGSTNSGPTYFAEVNNTLFFAAGGTNGFELWKSDGTTSGTAEVKDINPNGSGVYSELIPFNNLVLFAGVDTATQEQLFASDGTSNGTQKLTSIWTHADQNQWFLEPAHNRLYFAVDDDVHGRELWSSDGTTSGTNLVKDIRPGPLSSDAWYLEALNDKVAFSAYNAGTHSLYLSDGTALGTLPLMNAESGITSIENLNDTIFFSADSASSSFEGRHLWKTDGTIAGTEQITFGSGVPEPERLKAVNNEVYYGTEQYGFTSLWGVYKSDGTTSGTQLVKQFNFSFNNSAPADYHAFNGEVYFNASPGTSNSQLWKTDGTSAGSLLLGTYSVGVRGFITLGNKILFVAGSSTTGAELWQTDGTFAGTSLLKEINPGPADGIEINYYRRYPVKVGNKAYFPGTDSTGTELWETDGTPNGTTRVLDLNSSGNGVIDGQYNNQVAHGGYIYFTGDDGIHGAELWRSNGTSSGTQMVADIYPGPGSALPKHLTLAGDTLFFTAVSPDEGRELWLFDLRCMNPAGILTTDLTCPGDSTAVITLSTSGGVAPYSFSLDSVNFQNSPIFQNLPSGSYIGFVKDSVGCVVQTEEIVINEPNPPVVAITPNGDTTICIGTSITLEGSAGFSSYLWSSGNQTSQSIQVDAAGPYLLQATDSSGCVSVDSINVNVIQPNPASVTIDPGVDTTICAGTSLTLMASTGFASYVWTPGNQISQSIQVNSGGMYLLQATDSSGCVVSDSVMVNVQAPPTASFTYTPDSIYTFSDQSSGAVSWAWDFGDGATSDQQNPDHIYTSSGTYQVCLTVTDDLGCSDSTCQSIPVTLTSLSFNLPFSLQVAPNPGSGIYMLRGEVPQRNSEIRVINLHGQVILSRILPETKVLEEIDLQQFADGIYLIEVRHEQQVWHSKIIQRKE